MQTRFRYGDLAMIVNDEPGLDVNLGRLVKIIGAMRVDPIRGAVWPVTPTNQWNFLFNTERHTVAVDGNAGREHEDAWLMPIHVARANG
jgi:hypothetical protein